MSALRASAAGDHQKALARFEELHRREPDVCDHLFQIARCCNLLEDLPGVMASLEALELLRELPDGLRGAARPAAAVPA